MIGNHHALVFLFWSKAVSGVLNCGCILESPKEIKIAKLI